MEIPTIKIPTIGTTTTTNAINYDYIVVDKDEIQNLLGNFEQLKYKVNALIPEFNASNKLITTHEEKIHTPLHMLQLKNDTSTLAYVLLKQYGNKFSMTCRFDELELLTGIISHEIEYELYSEKDKRIHNLLNCIQRRLKETKSL